ncbi:MAG: isoprenylcysteine carboxylmethyltransferase family protein [candidate division KSB1 bacterium]|nr:isoprenylcysteine carboxylmethyltransferase family protein [candidate division KSB1 bacterium]
MDDLELYGAPRAWLWLTLSAITLAVPALVGGFLRRGAGRRYEKRFIIQRAPQLAIGVTLFLVSAAFEAIEFVLGTGEPAFGKRIFEAWRSALPFLSLALVTPPLLAGVVSWVGVIFSGVGLMFLVSGWYALGSAFSTDAEVLHGQELRQGGPFRFVMHPVYAGVVQFLFGSAVTTLSPVCTLATVGMVAPLLLRRARHEEQLLTEEFGAAYLEYAERMGWRRFVPKVIPVGV